MDSFLSQARKGTALLFQLSYNRIATEQNVESSSSNNIMRHTERHRFVKCKSPHCSSMSSSLYCQVPHRFKDNKWVPFHILFFHVSHTSAVFRRTANRKYTAVCRIYILPMNVEGALCLFALGCLARHLSECYIFYCVLLTLFIRSAKQYLSYSFIPCNSCKYEQQRLLQLDYCIILSSGLHKPNQT